MPSDKLRTESELKSGVEALINKYSWYHVMDLGFGFSTPGYGFGNLIPVAALMKNVRLENKRALDIATFDGKMAFLMENLGAEVVGVDFFQRDTILSLIEFYGSNVKCGFGIDDKDIPLIFDKFGYFDFVLCAGLLYHVYSPIDVILGVRKFTRNGGYAIFESACTLDSKNITMRFNRNDIYKDMSTIWVPSIACLRYLVKYACFRIVAEVTSHEPVARHAILAEAVKPGELEEGTGKDLFLEEFYLKKPFLPRYDWKAYESAEETSVEVKDFKDKHMKINPKNKRSYHEETELLNLATPAMSVANRRIFFPDKPF